MYNVGCEGIRVRHDLRVGHGWVGLGGVAAVVKTSDRDGCVIWWLLRPNVFLAKSQPSLHESVADTAKGKCVDSYRVPIRV